MNLFRATLLSVAILTPLTTFAHEAPIRVVVLGEDSDRNAVSRSSEIYTRNTVLGFVCWDTVLAAVLRTQFSNTVFQRTNSTHFLNTVF